MNTNKIFLTSVSALMVGVGMISAILMGNLLLRRDTVIPTDSLASQVYVHPNIILMIADGCGANHMEATNKYTGRQPVYTNWRQTWMNTQSISETGDINGITDSAAAATAMYTGHKTTNGRVAVDASGENKLVAFREIAQLQYGKAVGAVTTVHLSHATPGTWCGHNDQRINGYAIADECLWGDPNTTGSFSIHERYGGGHGVSIPPIDVMVGGGHPDFSNNDFVNYQIREKLVSEREQSEGFSYVESVRGTTDFSLRLLAEADREKVTKLVGLFGGEKPALDDMVESALLVLERESSGYVLMVEGGKVDWGGHNNDMQYMIREMDDFNWAVSKVSLWLDNPNTKSSWKNTLVIVTSDHETGWLTGGPGVSAHKPLGKVDAVSVGLEKEVGNTGRRASWDDINDNSLIDEGEQVNWSWGSGGHTRLLVPFYIRGIGSEYIDLYLDEQDPIRGAYIDNTEVFVLVNQVLSQRLITDPTVTPTVVPTLTMTLTPTSRPSSTPTTTPTDRPSYTVTSTPTPIVTPTTRPSITPTTAPTVRPSSTPTPQIDKTTLQTATIRVGILMRLLTLIEKITELVNKLSVKVF